MHWYTVLTAVSYAWAARRQERSLPGNPKRAPALSTVTTVAGCRSPRLGIVIVMRIV